MATPTPGTVTAPAGTAIVYCGRSPLPSWVPPAGQVVAYSSGGPVLSNRFNSVNVPFYADFHANKQVNDYSTGVANPWLGTLGGIVYFGGGHAGTNQNQLTGLLFSQSGMSFVRLADPTPWFGSGSDSATQLSNARDNCTTLLDASWGDAVPAVDAQRKPAANHTYGHNTVVPPANGGALYGTYFSACITAGPTANGGNYDGSHLCDLQSLSNPALNPWRRAGQTIDRGTTQVPAFTAYDPARNRTYLVSKNVGSSTRWYDHASNTWNVSANAGLNIGQSQDPDSGALVIVPERGLLVALTREGTNVALRYQDISGAMPGAAAQATLSANIPVGQTGTGNYWWANSAFWCPDNGKLIVCNFLGGGGTVDAGGVYEITIPATLGSSWTVTYRAFAAGTLPWPAGTWQGIHYFPRLKAAVVMFFAGRLSDSFPDVVYVYRPHGT